MHFRASGRVHAHLEVHQDNVEVAVLLELADGDAAVFSHDDFVPVLLETLRDDHTVDHL